MWKDRVSLKLTRDLRDFAIRMLLFLMNRLNQTESDKLNETRIFTDIFMCPVFSLATFVDYCSVVLCFKKTSASKLFENEHSTEFKIHIYMYDVRKINGMCS